MVTLLSRASFIGRMRYLLGERYFTRIMHAVLVLGCLGVTLVSAYLLGQAEMNNMTSVVKSLLPILAVGGLALFIITYSNLQMAAGLVFLTSLFLHDGIGTGTGTRITVTFILLNLFIGIWLFKMLVVDRKIQLRRSAANIPALIFMIIVVISFFWSYYYADTTVRFIFDDKQLPRLMTSLVLIISPATFLFFANQIRSERLLRFITWTFVAAGLIYLIPTVLRMQLPPLLNDRGLFPTWVGLLATGQAMFNRSLDWRLRLALLVVPVGWMYVQMDIGMKWLSGWLPLSLGLFILTFFYSRRLFGLLVVAVMILAIINLPFIMSVLNAENSESGVTRLGAWQNALAVTGEHYLFGTGPAGYHFYFRLFLIDLYQLSHNNYIDIIAQTGIIGFTVWIWFWLSMSRETWRMWRVIPRGNFLHGLGIALVACHICTFVIMMLGDWVTPFTYTQGLDGIDYTIWAWILAGMTVSVFYLSRPRATSPSAA